MNGKIKDEKLFLEIIFRNTGILIKVSNFYAHTKQDREDLINDMVYELWKSFGTFKGNSTLSTWLYRVALNTAMNYNRKNKRNPVIVFGVPDKEIKPLPWLAYEEGDSLNLLYEALDELNDMDKALILLYLEGRTHEEITSIMGISSTNVGTRLHRVKKQLKTIINSKE